ncbi:MAG: selenide, water dikinase SelD [Alphaproteobacteria bacterium]|jgi:selenide,water dikinase|nr:selenide, water dikinase SelD [Alphaproteobacteria bacterium]
MDATNLRLTSLAHGGGCGCKIAPAVLSQMLEKLPLASPDPALLVGAETSDDAAVYQINETQAVIATTDFFMPIVDDPFDFGRIAAANALSDIYAIGGRPLMALAVVGMPIDKLPVATIQDILAGGAAACEAAGITVAGGHSIDAPEPIYGLVAIGLADVATIKRNSAAEAGDVLILGKPLGIGILSAALKQDGLDAAGYGEMIEITTKLNAVGADLATLPGVHAMTDVTGFGLLGHTVELCRGAGLAAEVAYADLPILSRARALAERGLKTGASGRNWASYGHEVRLGDRIEDWQRDLLTDPQTNGGLLVAAAAGTVDQVLGLFHDQGYGQAKVIGRMARGAAEVRVN